MDIQFPEEQFKKSRINPANIPGWRRAFMRCVVLCLITYDRADTADKELTKKSITRAVLAGYNFGWALASVEDVNPFITSTTFPKKWATLVNDEVRRIRALTNPKTVVV